MAWICGRAIEGAGKERLRLRLRLRLRSTAVLRMAKLLRGSIIWGGALCCCPARARLKALLFGDTG